MMFEILSVVVLALASVNAEFKADCTNPCYCMANGLSWEGKLKYPFIFSSEDNDGKKYTYTFSPCGAKIDCGNTNKSVVLCQMDPTDTTESAYVVIGASGSGNVAWKFANESDTSHYTVTYGGGDNTFDTPPKPRKGVISVTLTTQFGPSFVFSGENSMPEELDYEFNANIPPGDTAPASIPLGPVGIVLICLVLGAVIAYFIIGSIVMFQVKGARGIEVVPNYTFWKDLPFLIKDGFLFTFQPCTGGCIKKNTYSSLS
ncbi:uncharacterized protein LOC135339861 isoform X1 [Halichondria panicea]|uniref:uncharacterized protein LOC135339861 isoform X1 n=1 Tax=Halichondria panicea TaxID=6063 RepID=UPI00312B3AD9